MLAVRRWLWLCASSGRKHDESRVSPAFPFFAPMRVVWPHRRLSLHKSENTRLCSEQRETRISLRFSFPFGFSVLLLLPLQPLLVIRLSIIIFFFTLFRLFTFIVVTASSSPVPLWILHTLPQRHPRRPYRTLTGRLPVATAARTSLQEQFRKRRVTRHGRHRLDHSLCTP